ncbi:hypothetical protein REPUB_Repub03eG0210100 [Reevesia pubescens]
MVMEGGESSPSKAKKVPAPPPPKKRSPMTIATLQIMKYRALKRIDRKKPDTLVRYFDNTDYGYGWLLPGWIAEERYIPSGRMGAGRLYTYYYDPAGTQYRTQAQVLYAWAEAGLICLDH